MPDSKLYQVDSVNIISPLEEKHHVEKGELRQANKPEEFWVPMNKLLKKNKDLFAKVNKDLGRTDTVKIRINTDGHVAIKTRPYCTSLTQRKLINEALEEMLESEIRVKSRSPWGFPVVLGEKMDACKRFSVDLGL